MSYGKTRFYVSGATRDLEFKDVDHSRESFLSQIDIGEPDECWFWMGHARSRKRSLREHPMFNIGERGQVSCRRVMLALDHGIAPAEFAIDTSCGWDLCLNPKHLDVREANGETITLGHKEYFFRSIEESRPREQVRRMQY